MSCTSASGFGEIFVEAEHRSGGARDLRDLDGVRQAVAEMIGEARREDLGLGFQAAKGARMNDAIAIALEGIAVRMLRFRIAAAGAALDREAKALRARMPRLLCPGSSPKR